MSEPVQLSFGPYEAIEVVQQGATAIVYKGRQPSLGRSVAINVLVASHNPQFAARFQREARAIAQLEHHNILPVYDYGEQDGLLYFVTQYVEHGSTLQEILGEPMEPVAALQLVVRVLDGLAYAHDHGVIHRNIKPSSILLPLPEWPLLSDFGIAKFVDDNQTMTMPTIGIESARYMAPEQFEGRPTDARTDLYALGVVVYHMLTGRVPFDAPSAMAVLRQHAVEPLPAPRSFNPTLPEPVEGLLTTVLAKAPDERYASARAMAEDVQRVLVQLEQSHGDGRVQALYESGLQAFRAGEWSQALGLLTQVHELDPQHADVSHLLAFARQAQQQARTTAELELARLSGTRQPFSFQRVRPFRQRTVPQTELVAFGQDEAGAAAPAIVRGEQPVAAAPGFPNERPVSIARRVLGICIVVALLALVLFALSRLAV